MPPRSFFSTVRITTTISVLLILVLGSCQSDSPQVIKLRKEIAKKRARKKILAQNVALISKELETLWVRSLKYRFPKIQPINGEEVPLDLAKENLPYLKALCLARYNSSNELALSCSYKTKEKKVHPKFTLYLFDKYGINIHKQVVTYKKKFFFFGKHLPPGKLVTQKYKIKVAKSRHIPRYFLIGPAK